MKENVFFLFSYEHCTTYRFKLKEKKLSIVLYIELKAVACCKQKIFIDRTSVMDMRLFL